MKAIKTLLKVVTVIALLLIGLIACAIHFGIWFSRPLNTPLDRPSTYSNSLWTAEDGKYAFVADDDADLFGYGQKLDDVLYFRIGPYSDDLEGHQLEVFLTGKSQLPDAMRAVHRRWGREPLELLITGSARLTGQEDYVIEMRTDEDGVIRFQQHKLSQEYSFEDTPEWPDEMLRWIEQQE